MKIDEDILNRSAQLWCLPEHKNKTMDPKFCEAIAHLCQEIRDETLIPSINKHTLSYRITCECGKIQFVDLATRWEELEKERKLVDELVDTVELAQTMHECPAFHIALQAVKKSRGEK